MTKKFIHIKFLKNYISSKMLLKRGDFFLKSLMVYYFVNKLATFSKIVMNGDCTVNC